MSLFKANPARDPDYLAWVRSQPSCISGNMGYDPDTGERANDPHHPKGHGLGGTVKCSDYLAIPLTREEHRAFHAMGWQSWEVKYGSQWEHAARTMERYLAEKQK